MKTIFFSLLLTVTLFATSSHAAQKSGADIKKDSMENNPKAAKQQYSKPTDNELRRKLTPMQYNVTQKGRTEPPFKNEYWDNNSPGIYVDVVSGEPLFSSLDKFDSQTGWPSFVKPLIAENVSEKKDEILFLPRTEVRSYLGDSHLGYVFNDGPKPTGLKYCINSAALRFIPVGGLKKAGYGRFLPLFKSRKIRHK